MPISRSRPTIRSPPRRTATISSASRRRLTDSRLWPRGQVRWAILGAVLGFSLWLGNGGRSLRLSFDILTVVSELHGPPTDRGVLVVSLDQELLRRSGVPGEARLHRRALAAVLARIARFKPAAIGLDVQLPGLTSLPEDQGLADAVRGAGRVIVPEEILPGTRPVTMREPIRPIAVVASQVGFVNIWPDPDGYLRRVRLVHPVESCDHYHFSVYASTALLGTESVSRREDRLLLKNRAPIPPTEVPLGPGGECWIRFRSDRAVPILPGSQLLDAGEEDPRARSLITGRLVLVGGTDPIFQDHHAVPFNRFDAWRARMPGTLVLAQVIENLVTGKLLHEPPALAGGALLVLLGAGCGLLIPRRSLPGTILIALASAVAVSVGSIHLFVQGVLLDAVSLVAVPSTLLLLSVARRFRSP